MSPSGMKLPVRLGKIFIKLRPLSEFVQRSVMLIASDAAAVPCAEIHHPVGAVGKRGVQLIKHVRARHIAVFKEHRAEHDVPHICVHLAGDAAVGHQVVVKIAVFNAGLRHMGVIIVAEYPAAGV